MTRKWTGAVVIAFVLLGGCESHAPRVDPQRRVTDAQSLTRHYARSALAQWKVRANAAGADCAVLVVQTSILMEDAMVDALHYGAGAYDIYEGGVQSFSKEHAFRAVAYRDPSGRVWTYGSLTATEAANLAPCR